jgi:uncharacterized protein (TIGR02466 family)
MTASMRLVFLALLVLVRALHPPPVDDIDASISGQIRPQYLSLLFSAPVLRTSLTEFLPAASSAVGIRNSLRESVLESWRVHAGSDVARDHELNDGFFAFQKREYGEADFHSHPRGWISTKAGQDLLLALTASVGDYLERIGGEREIGLDADRMHVWASVHESCSSHPRHVHPGATVSGVVYLSVPLAAGSLVFSDPRGAVPPFEDTVRFEPDVGDLVLFPPWLPHEVSPNCAASSPRMSISFNYVDPPKENDVWGSATARFTHAIPPAPLPVANDSGGGGGGSSGASGGEKGLGSSRAPSGTCGDVATSKATAATAATATTDGSVGGGELQDDLARIHKELKGLRRQVRGISKRLQDRPVLERGRREASPSSDGNEAVEELLSAAAAAEARETLERILTESAVLLEEVSRATGGKASIRIEVSD